MKIIRLISIVSIVVVGATLIFQRDRVKAQDSKQIGTINGKPLQFTEHAARDFALKHDRQPTDNDQQEIASIASQSTCSYVKGQITQAAREQVKRQFAVYVSPGEVAQANDKMAAEGIPSLQLSAQKWITYNQAAHQVFDLHQDPEQVYRTVVAPVEENPTLGHKVWQANLINWSTPEGRAGLAKMAQTAAVQTPESMKGSIAKATQQTLERQKLEDAVDAQLAAQDAQFRTYLNEWNKSLVPSSMPSSSPFERTSRGIEIDHLNYLKQKRNEFWQARYAQQQVTLNDPTLAAQCQLGSTMGVKVAGK